MYSLFPGYDELTCRCGAEVIYPPIPCGTRPPVCSQPCGRLHSCSHPVNHTCHSDDHCPKCTFLTEKMCMGGHEVKTMNYALCAISIHFLNINIVCTYIYIYIHMYLVLRKRRKEKSRNKLKRGNNYCFTLRMDAIVLLSAYTCTSTLYSVCVYTGTLHMYMYMQVHCMCRLADRAMFRISLRCVSTSRAT